MSMTVTRPQLVALDVDGTIVDYDNRMSEVVRTTLEAVVGGRPPRGRVHRPLRRRRAGDGQPSGTHRGLRRRLERCSGRAARSGVLQKGWVVQHVETFDPRPALDRLVEVMPTALYMVEDENLVRYASADFPTAELADMDDFTIIPFDELKERRATRIVMREPNGTSDEFREAVERVGLHGVAYSVGWSNWLDIAPEGVLEGPWSGGRQRTAGRCARRHDRCRRRQQRHRDDRVGRVRHRHGAGGGRTQVIRQCGDGPGRRGRPRDGTHREARPGSRRQRLRSPLGTPAVWSSHRLESSTAEVRRQARFRVRDRPAARST